MAFFSVAEHPGVLASAALRRVDDERALGQGHAGETARDDLDVAPVDDERAFGGIVAGGFITAGDKKLLAAIVDEERRDVRDALAFGLGFPADGAGFFIEGDCGTKERKAETFVISSLPSATGIGIWWFSMRTAS